MQPKSKIKLYITIFLSICACIAAGALYINQLRNTINDSTTQNMTELCEHDLQNIENILDSVWTELENMGARLAGQRVQNVEDLQFYLNLETAVASFDTVYLIDSKGRLYTTSYLIVSGTDKSYVQRLLDGEERLVMWHDDFASVEQQRETILYGTQIEPFSLNQIEFVALVGINDIQNIENRLKIESFNGKGYSTIVDQNGYYIAQQNRSLNIAERSNFYDWLRGGTYYGDDSAEKVIERIQNKEEFSMTYTNAAGEERLVIFRTIPNTEWFLISNIQTSVLQEQARSFLLLTLFLLICIVLVIAFLLLIILKVIRNSYIIKAQAQAKTDFLSSMSHEIRTPLNGIIGLNHLMKSNVKNIPKLEEYLQKSAVTAEYLLTLINDILDMNKLSEHRIELENKPFSLPMLIESLQDMFQSRMDEKRIRFEIQTQVVEPDIMGDEMRLKQVLINVIGNAVKFTPNDGAITLRTSQIKKEHDLIYTRFDIEDTGCGMSDEFQKHIFESFTQERNALSKEIQGTGLGMSISYLLMKQMGGELSVTSQLHVGSCFTAEFTTEIAKEAVEINTPQLEPVQGTTPSDRPLHILIAEDIELNAEILSEILQEAGFVISLARNGKAALEAFEASGPNEIDVILMDVQMPVMNGFEAAKAIRSLLRPDAQTVKIFACTANTFEEDHENANASGMNDFIAKPIDVSTLLSKLNLSQGQEES